MTTSSFADTPEPDIQTEFIVEIRAVATGCRDGELSDLRQKALEYVSRDVMILRNRINFLLRTKWKRRRGVHPNWYSQNACNGSVASHPRKVMPAMLPDPSKTGLSRHPGQSA